jgi:transcriptional regulator with XRE-family HTH domain
MVKGEETLSAEFGLRLRQERDRLGISQADMALLAGVSREMWGRYERGATPSSDVLIAVQAHGVDINFVCGGSRTLSQVTLTDDEQDLLGLYRGLDIEGRAAVARAARMESLRLKPPPAANPFAVPEPEPPLVLHETKRKPRKTPPR